MPSDYSLTHWKTDDERDFIVPSGQKCRVRDLGLEDMAMLGIIDQMDTLGMLVEKQHVQRVQGKRPQDRQKKKLTKAQQAKADAAEQGEIVAWLRDRNKMSAIGIMLDKIASVCVVEPVVENPWVPIDENDSSKGERKLARHERIEEALYADKLPFNDKMAIFEEGFKGMEDLESFREGSGEDVAALPDVEEPEEDSE